MYLLQVICPKYMSLEVEGSFMIVVQSHCADTEHNESDSSA